MCWIKLFDFDKESPLMLGSKPMILSSSHAYLDRPSYHMGIRVIFELICNSYQLNLVTQLEKVGTHYMRNGRIKHLASQWLFNMKNNSKYLDLIYVKIY